MQLPDELIRRMEAVLRGLSRKQLRQDASRLSAHLRARTTEPVPTRTMYEYRHEFDDDDDRIDVHQAVPPVPYDTRQSVVYVAHRVPGVYACNFKVLNELKLRFPGFRPRTMMDFGSGPGTAVWAARENFSSLERFMAVEPSDGMISVSNTLLDGTASDVLACELHWRERQFETKC